MKALLSRLRARWRPRGRRVKTPTVLQMEAVECGAACLAIVLAHFGRWEPLEKLRIACGVSRDGSKASNVLKAARRYGLQAKGFKKQPEALRKMDFPVILHWNFNHFLVLEGIRDDRVYLNDPAMGPRQVTFEELDQSFTGVVLTFKTTDDFEPSGAAPSILPALGRRVSTSLAGLLFVLLAGLALVFPGLIVPVFSKIFVDEILIEGRQTWLNPLLFAMGLTAFLLGALTWLQQSFLLRLETKMALAGSSRFLWHVMRLPTEFFSQRFAGDISTRMRSNDRVAQLLSRDLATNALGVLVVLFYAAVMLRYDVVLTLVGIAVAALNVAALRFVGRKRVDGNRQLMQEKGKLIGTAIGGLQMIETYKASGSESDLYSRWAGFQAKVVNLRQRLEGYTQVLNAVPPLLAALTTALILAIGGLRVIDGELSLGSLIAFQVLMVSFMHPINQLVNLGGKLQTVEADMARLDDVLRYPIDPALATLGDDDAPDGRTKLAGHLELRDVSFGYSRLDPPLIEGFSLRLEPGSRVALVGGSGSGKSTVARLVTGLHEPWGGEILFDGKARQEIPRRLMTRSLAVVDQTIFLFEGTVRENLTLWDATIPLPDVVEAARDALIHDDIAARSGGYESLVAEGGANFSGGQRQRLEIARALVTRPSLLVLDEATSALDSTTESRIDQNLRRRGCTCLIVAHRLSTIRDADEIIVLEGGKIVQRGTHDELSADPDGSYATLIAHE